MKPMLPLLTVLLLFAAPLHAAPKPAASAPALSKATPPALDAARAVSQTLIITNVWPTSAAQGETIMWEGMGSNTGTSSGGPFDVTQFKIQITIPEQLQLRGQTSEMGSFTVEGQVLTLDIGDFEANEDFNFSMEFDVVGGGAADLGFEVLQFEFHPGPTTFNCAITLTITPVAYVDDQAAGPGVVGSDTTPFNSYNAALEALFNVAGENKQVCVKPGTYPGTTTFREGVTNRTWDGQPGGALDIPGTVGLDQLIIDTDAPVHFGPPGLDNPANANFSVERALDIIRGDIFSNGHLDVSPGDGETATVTINRDGNLNGGDTGRLRFSGSGTSDVFVETGTGRLRFDFPPIDINGPGLVTFDGGGSASGNDILGTPHFTLNDGSVELRQGIDLLDVFTDYDQLDGEFLMAGISSIGGTGDPTRQVVQVGGGMTIEDGTFFTSGGDVEVFGDFQQGANGGQDPGDALFSLEPEGIHTVVGDFTVGADIDPEGDGEARNRYILGNGELDLFGDYNFFGTGDVFDDNAALEEEQGLRGAVVFRGDAPQNVMMRQDEDAFFNDVVMAGPGGVRQQSVVWQNDTGTLTLELGNILDPEEESFDWIILNLGTETDLAGRNNSGVGQGIVQLGSRDSYTNGGVQRAVSSAGTSSDGQITGGYLFPVGTLDEERNTGGGTIRDVDFFRPLILQFPDNLGQRSIARVEYQVDMEAKDVAYPNEGLTVDGINLDVIGDQFWKLEFDRIPSFDPNVRIEAADLPNVFEIKEVRLIQWDCDGTNPRPAGLYNTDANPNEMIDGVPNLTQEAVPASECSLIGIGASFVDNPINIKQDITAETPRKQFINSTLSNVDVYTEGSLVVDDLIPDGATPFFAWETGGQVIDIVSGDAADNSSALFSTTINPQTGEMLLCVIDEQDGQADLFIKDDARLQAQDPANTDIAFFNSIPGEVTIHVFDENGMLIQSLPPVPELTFSDYAPLPPEASYFTTSSDGTLQYFEIQGFSPGEAGVGIIGESTSVNKRQNVMITFYRPSGAQVLPADITATEPGVLPEAFALHVNYPNPFNPATRISYDLPARADVTLTIYDTLGRTVRTLVTGDRPAGRHTATWDGRNAAGAPSASGIYLYRLQAGSFVQTRSMLLVK